MHTKDYYVVTPLISSMMYFKHNESAMRLIHL